MQIAVVDRPDDMKFEKITDPVERKKAHERSIAIGREMFLREKPGTFDYTEEKNGKKVTEKIAVLGGGCIKCHGPTELGDGQTTDYDDWTKQIWSKEVWHTAESPPASELLPLGALPERHIIPRNLRLGVYHGGRRPLDIYYRVHEGIKGAPMPANADSLLTAEEKQSLQKVQADADRQGQQDGRVSNRRRRFRRAAGDQAIQEKRVHREDRRTPLAKRSSRRGFGIWWISCCRCPISRAAKWESTTRWPTRSRQRCRRDK